MPQSREPRPPSGAASTSSGYLSWSRETSPGPVLLQITGRAELFQQFFVENVLQRFLEAPAGQSFGGGHRGPLWYYFLRGGPAITYPWFLALPSFYLVLRRGRLPEEWNRAAVRATGWILPVALVGLTIPDTKRDLYLLPVLPMMAIGLGAWATLPVAGPLHRFTRHFIAGLSLTLTLMMLVTLVVLETGVPLSHFGEIPVHLPWWVFVPPAAYFAWAILRPYWKVPDSSRASVLALGLFICLNVSLLPALEPAKELHTFARYVGRIWAAAPSMASFHLDETTRGILSFDLGRNPTVLSDAVGIRQFAMTHPDGLIVMMDRAVPYIPRDVALHLELVEHWDFPGNRGYAVYRVGRWPPPVRGLPVAR